MSSNLATYSAPAMPQRKKNNPRTRQMFSTRSSTASDPLLTGAKAVCLEHRPNLRHLTRTLPRRSTAQPPPAQGKQLAFLQLSKSHNLSTIFLGFFPSLSELHPIACPLSCITMAQLVVVSLLIVFVVVVVQQMHASWCCTAFRSFRFKHFWHTTLAPCTHKKKPCSSWKKSRWWFVFDRGSPIHTSSHGATKTFPVLVMQ